MSFKNINFFIYILCYVYLETLLLSAVHAGTTIILPENVILNKNSTATTASSSASSSAAIPTVQNFTTTKSFRSASPAAAMGMMSSAAPTSGTFHTGREAVLHVLQCIFQKDARVQCFLDRAQRALDYEREKLLAQADSDVDQYYHLHQTDDNNNGRASTTNEKPTAVSNIITELTDMLSESVGTFFTGKKGSAKDIAAAIGSELTGGTGDDEEDDDDADEVDETETNSANAVERTSKSVGAREHEEADVNIKERPKRKRRISKIHKLIALLKLLIFGRIVRAKIDFLIRLLNAHLQVKFFLVALGGLIISAIRLYYDLKKAKAEKYLYYEHAHHDHHYEKPEPELGGNNGYWNGGGAWRRSFATRNQLPDMDSVHKVVYSGQIADRKRI